MSDMLAIGASGLRAYQTALTTVSDNIANASTPGYVRRTATIAEVGTTSSGPQGSLVTGTARSGDDIKAAAVRSAGTDLARSESSIGWMDRIESALGGNDLGTRLTSFFDAATTLSGDPTSSASRSVMLEAAGSAAQAFAGTGQALDQVGADLDSSATTAVGQLNSIGAALAKVNDGLGRTQPNTDAAAQLSDQRDQLLEQMSAISDVTVTLDQAGRATVKLGDASGPVLVQGIVAGQVSYARNDEGAVSFAVARAGVTNTAHPAGGALAAIAEGVQRVAAAREQLNTVASGFTTAVNANQAQGRDLSGQPGQPLFATGATATDISVALTDPRGIAAASVGAGTRDNGNLLALASLRTSGGYEAATTAITSANAAALAQRKTVADAQSAIHDGAISARDSASGVNLDSEAVDLMRFQQAYGATARVIQVARETIQSILDIR